MIEPDDQMTEGVIIAGDTPPERKAYGLRHLRTVAMLSYVLASVASSCGEPNLGGFVPSVGGGSTGLHHGHCSQPKLRKEARRTGKHPAHHRKTNMSLRYARNHSR